MTAIIGRTRSKKRISVQQPQKSTASLYFSAAIITKFARLEIKYYLSSVFNRLKYRNKMEKTRVSPGFHNIVRPTV